MNDSEKLSIGSTPIEICAAALGRLDLFWDEVADQTGIGKGLFISEVFGGIWRDGDRGEKFEAEIDSWDEQPQELQALGLIQALFICCAYACQAMKAQKNDDMRASWWYTTKCEYWLGIVIGAWSIRSTLDDPMKQFSKAGTDVRHAENRAMKNDVLKWLDTNIGNYKSMDRAAEDISRKIAPVAFRTARGWVGEWKKLRSTGKP